MCLGMYVREYIYIHIRICVYVCIHIFKLWLSLALAPAFGISVLKIYGLEYYHPIHVYAYVQRRYVKILMDVCIDMFFTTCTCKSKPRLMYTKAQTSICTSVSSIYIFIDTLHICVCICSFLHICVYVYVCHIFDIQVNITIFVCT